MIASTILALYLFGYIPVEHAVPLLYASAGLLVFAEFFLGTFGIVGVNGFMSLLVAVALQSKQPVMFGLIPIGWGMFFGVAFFELCLLIGMALIIISARKRKASTGIEALIGSTARVVEWHGKKGRVTIEGETWNAISVHDLQLNRDDEVTIESVKRLTLTINA